MTITEESGGEAAVGSAPFKCKGTVASAIVNGEADIEVFQDAFALTLALDATRVPWYEVTLLSFEDYAVNVRTKTGQYALSKLGRDGEPLYNHMLSAYGAKVRKALFVSGNPAVKAKGDAGALRGVPIEVYENCVLSLPPDLSARRVPLSFVTGYEDKDFTLKLSVLDGSEAIYSKLGYEHAPVVKAVLDGMKKLRANTVAQISELAPAVSAEQAMQLVRLMPEGMAAPVGAIRGIAPAFADALEERLALSRAAETYKAFKDMADPDAICIGFKKNDMGAFSAAAGEKEESEGSAGGEAGGLMEAIAGTGVADGSEVGETQEKADDPYMLWIVTPAPSGNACAVEFAVAEGESAATFVYRFDCGWDAFRIRLCMALEAIAFKRDVIRMTDEEIAKPENADCMMACDRNEALQFVRSCFAGRAIHRSMDSWRQQVSDLLR